MLWLADVQCPVVAADVPEGADPSTGRSSSEAVQRPGAVAVFCYKDLQICCSKAICGGQFFSQHTVPFPWECHCDTDCGIGPAPVHVGEHSYMNSATSTACFVSVPMLIWYFYLPVLVGLAIARYKLMLLCVFIPLCLHICLFIYLFSCSYKLDVQPGSTEKPKAMPNISNIFCSVILTLDIYIWIRVVWYCSQSPLRWPDIRWKLQLRAWCVSKLFSKFPTLVISVLFEWNGSGWEEEAAAFQIKDHTFWDLPFLPLNREQPSLISR